ncbi:MAG: hypothetical protein JNN05_07265 [Candidatus Omnitrophica bacterium]|nr:hypothetical protein [Candidatus Omnitrophota bacterium]
MWFFMITCYIFSTISFLMLLTVFAQSFYPFKIIHASALSFLILTSIIYLFTETLIMFFFVGTGVSIKEYMLEQKIYGDFHQRSIGVKRRVYPPQLLNLLILMIAFILFGAADTQKISPWLYRAVLAVGIIQFIDAKLIQNICFRDNTKIILDMSGIKRA